MMNNGRSSSWEKVYWVVFSILVVFATGTATIKDNWIGYTYVALACLAVFVYDFRIVKNYWIKYIPGVLTVAYLIYEPEPMIFILKHMFGG